MLNDMKTRGTVRAGAAARLRAALLITIMAGLLCGSGGCGHKNANASDPDPNYYKGRDFHGRPGKR